MDSARRPRRTIAFVAIIIVVGGIGSFLVLSPSLMSKPRLQVSSATCYIVVEIHHVVLCQMLFSNNSTQSIGIKRCSITLDGIVETGSVQAASNSCGGCSNLTSVSGSITSLKVYCFAYPPSNSFTTGPAGSSVNGTITTDTTVVPFYGKWLF